MRARLFLFAIAATALAACGGSGDSTTQPSGGGTPTPPAPTVATVSVSGASSVDVGKTIQLTASALDAAGAAITGKTFTWSSSNDAVASVASDGTVSGKSAGTASISASVDGKTGSTSVTVTAPGPAVASIAISGTTAVQAGTTTQLTATVKDSTGATLMTVPVTWSSSDTTLMTVSNAGLVNAAHIASVTITAAAGGKSATTTITSSLAPYTFIFDSGTSASDAQLIKDAVQYATGYYLSVFGRTITTATTVSGAASAPGCDSRSGNAAFTGPGAVTFCVANAGWLLNGPISRQKITMHELFHVWQFQYKWLGNPNIAGADWAIEGSAELMGYNAVASKGLLTMPTVRGCMIKQVTDFAKQQPPGLPALSTLESASVFQTTVGPTYPYAMLAMDQLTTGAGGLVSLKAYGDAIASGTAWQTAFQTAFGTSLSAFYAQYPGYLSGLTIPVNYLCGV